MSVLAGTFSALAVLPLVSLTEIGFTIAIGVLLDTEAVRRGHAQDAIGLAV